MIADRHRLAAQVRELYQELGKLTGWVDNPDRPFPGDAVALGGLASHVAELFLADDIPDAPLVCGEGL